MLIAVRTPRINNNDDQVRLSRLAVEVGRQVSPGETLAEIETDKATMAVEAGHSGRVLAIAGQTGEMIDVGSVLVWLGSDPDDRLEPVPVAVVAPEAGSRESGPTAKAKELLVRYGLDARDVPASRLRLTAQDVENYVAAKGAAHDTAARPTPPPDLPEGNLEPLSLEERGMLRGVLWHRDEAVPAYLETAYDGEAWKAYAQDFSERHRQLFDPLLGLMAHQLAWLAHQNPKWNSTIAGDQRWQYRSVHLGFTVQAGPTLYLAVVREADRMQRLVFVRALLLLQRRAQEHKLGSAETSGATVGFTSMERWHVGRHVPVLPPHVSLMVAHTVDSDQRAVLGATYDHRLLTGAEVVKALKRLAVPVTDEEMDGGRGT